MVRSIDHFLANLHSFTLSAKFREILVWKASSISGEMFTNISVLLSPSKQRCRTWVNLEFRKGMCYNFLRIPLMTVPRELKDLLMNWVSLRLSPSTLLCLIRSLPARSTRTKDPFLISLVTVLVPSSLSETMRWDRLDLSFMLVAEVFRLYLASLRQVSTSIGKKTYISLTLSMVVVHLPIRSMMVSRQIYWMDRKTEYFHLNDQDSAISSKMSSMLRGVSPRWLQLSMDSLNSTQGPMRVQVFPEPVWPQAKMQTFFPSMELWTRVEISQKTLPWLVVSEKSCQKTKCSSQFSCPSMM